MVDIAPPSAHEEATETVYRLLQRVKAAEDAKEAAEKAAKSDRDAKVAAEKAAEDLRAEIQNLTTWTVHRDFNDVVRYVLRRVKTLSAHAIVPHMRKVGDFENSEDAIGTAPTNEELVSARSYIESLDINIQFKDFVAEGIDDAVAYEDRGRTGTIFFSDELGWGLARLESEDEARFVGLATAAHEIGHKTWFQFRGEAQGNSPESFKGAISRKVSGSEVMRSTFSAPLRNRADGPLVWSGSRGARLATWSKNSCSVVARNFTAARMGTRGSRAFASSTPLQAGNSRGGSAC